MTDALKQSIQSVIEVLEAIKKTTTDDAKQQRAIERAKSWLMNITNPLTAEELAKLPEVKENWIGVMMDDKLANTLDTDWDATMTDEDYRGEIVQYIEMMEE